MTLQMGGMYTLIESYIDISSIYYWCIRVKIIYHLMLTENVSTYCHGLLSQLSTKLNFNEFQLISPPPGQGGGVNQGGRGAPLSLQGLGGNISYISMDQC
jgi:hypothetical protein